MVEDAFEQFHREINLPGNHRATANRRAEWIVGRLRPHFTVIDAFPIGSIPKYTALQDHADLDVLVVLHHSKHIKNRLPSTVLANVRKALGPGVGRVRRNGQAVTMTFTSWPNVDVVPASRTMTSDGTKVSRYKIPDMNRELWLPTRPRRHSSKINAAASVRGPLFRQIIKMVKDWSRRQPVKLQSYHIEVIALKTSSTWDEYTWPIFQWFDAAIEAVDWCWHDGQDISGYLSPADADKAKAQLQQAKDAARWAWWLTYGDRAAHREAIGIWKQIFGRRFPGL
jgi:hypothetical protein